MRQKKELYIFKKEYLIVFLIFLFGFIIRILSVYPANTEIGFDQARDLFTATTIFRDHHLAIIGPTAGNNPNLHHGVAFWYYIVIPLIAARGNPTGVLIWNSFFNALVIVVLFFLGRDLFKSNRGGIIAAILGAVSYQIVQYSGWISNPTATILTVPIFFYALWKYYQGKKWGLPIVFLFMGLSIEFELFFLYLIPVTFILFTLLRMKWPNFKLLVISIILFCLSTSTMIATEIKFHFAGILSIINANKYLGGTASHQPFGKLFVEFITKWDFFSFNFAPGSILLGKIIGLAVMGVLLFDLVRYFKIKEKRDRVVFIILYFLSPSLMFFLGTSNEPWFLIGRPVAIVLAFSYLLLKVKPKILVTFVLVFVIFSNISAIHNSYGKGQVLLEPDPASIMSDQLAAIYYTYKSSNGEPFEINTLTNPLYINSVWGYHYYWYGNNNYGYLPTFAGGNQLYPYNTLSAPSGKEKFLYLIMDNTERIPPQYRKEIISSSDKISKLIEEKNFGGIVVQKRILK
jgi:hypothetical protein